MQSITRASAGLPITEFELTTMGFVVCALIMHVLWWNKPFDVDQRTIIQLDYPERFLVRLEQDELLPGAAQFTWRVSDVGPINMDNIVKDERIELQALVFYASALIFSGIHIAAWNWKFPSSLIRTLWRIYCHSCRRRHLSYVCVFVLQIPV